MFEKLDPRKGKMLQILKPDGTLTSDYEKFPKLSNEELIKAFTYMIKAREADDWAVSLNRQGRMPTYAQSKGQEANSVGALLALKDTDWFVPAFRELGGMLLRNIPLSQIYLYWFGNEEGSRLNLEKYHTLPISVPIASQTLYGVGMAFADKYLGEDSVTLSYVGDGGTSEGDFSEAMNFASVWNAPAILYIQNNQWAISVPRAKQTMTKTLAEKAFAFGLEGVQVDGNDIMAVYAAVSLAAEKARKGEGPTVIEGFTYRLGPHTTADDPKRYRKDEEVDPWLAKDPLIRLEKYLIKEKILSEKEIESIKEDTKQFVKDAFNDVEAFRNPTIEAAFEHTFKVLPPILEKQLAERKKLEGGEA